MAVVVNGTIRLAEAIETGTDPYTSGSFTIADNAVVSVGVWTSGSTDAGTPTPTDTFANLGAWTLVNTRLQGTTDRLQVWRAVMAGTGGAGTVTFTFSVAPDPARLICMAMEATGEDTTTPETQDVIAGGTANTITLALAAALGAGAASVSHVAGRQTSSGDIVVGTGETLIGSCTHTATATNKCHMITQYSTDQTHDATTVPTTANNGVCWEIAQAAAAGWGALLSRARNRLVQAA